ncbi:MAG: cell division protein ZipA C-terminal FtsZ-binding domain-containing protein [Pseudomonadota bacterium]
MSDLQIILIILGAFIIAGVVVYNWLQERKLQNQVMNEFIVPQKDVLAEDFYIDTDAFVEKELAEVPQKFKQPIFDESNSNRAAQSRKENIAGDTVPLAQMAEAELDDTVNYSDIPTAYVDQYSDETSSAANGKIVEDERPVIHTPTAATKLPPVAQSMPEIMPSPLPDSVHTHIDLAAMLFANQKISHKALCDMAESVNEIRLPMMIFGLDSHDKWHLVQSNQSDQTLANTADTQYKQAACSLQLADRGGPIAKSTLNKFQYAVENMGLELNAHVEWQGSGDVLQRALELDQFCIEVDQLINVHVAQGELPIHGTKFRGLAEASGMVLSEDGRFHYYASDSSAQKTPLFCVVEANHQAFTADSLRNNVLKAVTFQLEIPKVPNCEQAFNQMIHVAQKLSTSLNAKIVDDNQKPLGDLQIEKIRQQLKIIHATMVARGVMPGSVASMRLFN